jgi:hypothetical protein
VNREEMRLLTEHCAWADRTLMQALMGTPSDIWWKAVPSSYGTLFATVLHLFGTEWTWLERVNGRSPTRVGPGTIESPDRLMEEWSLVWQGWRQVVEHLDPDLEIAYRTTSGEEFGARQTAIQGAASGAAVAPLVYWFHLKPAGNQEPRKDVGVWGWIWNRRKLPR